MAIRRRTVLWLVLGAVALVPLAAIAWGIGVPTLRERSRLSAMTHDEVFAGAPAGLTPHGDRSERAGDFDLYGDWSGGRVVQNYLTAEPTAAGANAWVVHLNSTGWTVRTLRCPTESRPDATLSAEKDMGGFTAMARIYVDAIAGRSQLRVESPDDGRSSFVKQELPPPVPSC